MRMAHDAAACPVTAEAAASPDTGAAEGSSAREDGELMTAEDSHTAAAGLLGVALGRFMRARSSRSRSPVGSARLAAHANMSDGDIRELLVLMTARIDDLENSVDGLKAQIRLLGDQIPLLQAELERQIGRNLQRHDRQYDLTVNSIRICLIVLKPSVVPRRLLHVMDLRREHPRSEKPSASPVVSSLKQGHHVGVCSFCFRPFQAYLAAGNSLDLVAPKCQRTLASAAYAVCLT